MLLLPLCAFTDGGDHYYYNPVARYRIGDPTIIRAEDGNFYLSCSGWTPIFKSSDLVDWQFLCPAFTESGCPSFVEGANVWAPDISYINGKYVIHYCMSLWGGIQSCGVGVAVSDKVEGPYTDLGKLFISSEIGAQNSIDQFFFEDDDGSKWLFWGSYRGIYVIQLSDDGLSLREGAVKQRVSGYLTEGTCIYKRDGYYYMIGSTGTCCVGVKSTYHLMVARSKNLLGPYVDKDGLPALTDHMSMLLHGNDVVKGTGHCSEVFEDDAGQTWLMYHGYEADKPEVKSRVLYMDQILWDSEGWPYIVGDEPSECWSRPILNGMAKEFTYSDVDYIEYDGDLNGNCLFDTGYVPKENTRIDVKCRPYSVNKAGEATTERLQAVFTSCETKSDGFSLYTYDKEFTVYSDGEFWSYFGGGYVDDTISPLEYDIDYEFSASRYGLVINGESYPADASAYGATTKRLTMFCGYQGEYPGKTFCGRIYSLQVYEGDALIHDYRPCLRNEDGMPMFHDVVTDVYLHPSDPRAFGYGKVLK